jgi:PAS domain-containing protein
VKSSLSQGVRAKGFSPAVILKLMDKKKTVLSSLTFRYVLALGILAVLSLASYLILKENIKANEGSAAVINISGRQRMFSQRIAFLSLRLVVMQGSAEKEKIRKALALAAGVMEKSHNSLIKGDSVIELRRMPSRQMQAMYFSPSLNLDAQVRRYLEKARGLLSFSDTEIGLQNPNLQYIIEAAQGDLLNSLDAVVKQYQLESEAKIARLKILQRYVVLSAMCVLLITGIFIFRPMLKGIRQKTDALERHEAALIKANELLRQKISESEILARQLRVTNEFDAALLRTIPFGIDIVDTQGSLLYINEKMQQIVGQEALGKKCYLLYKDDKQQCLR